METQIRGALATLESHCAIACRFEHHGILHDLEVKMRLFGRLETLESVGWKKVSSEPIYANDKISSAVPISPETMIPFEEAIKTPEPFRYVAWHPNLQGLQCRTNLPNDEDRESVRNIISGNKNWLGVSWAVILHGIAHMVYL